MKMRLEDKMKKKVGQANSFVGGKKKNPLVGLFLHTYNEEGKIEWQGHVEDEIADGAFLVALFSWMHGYFSNYVVMRVQDMVEKNATFYADKDDWLRVAGERQ